MKEGWEYKKLGEVCESDLGKTLNQAKDTGNLRPYLCAVNIQWDKIDLTTLKQTKFEDSELERYTVRKGDLLVCEGGDIGRAAIWDKEEPILYQNALHRIRFNGEVLSRFCLLYLHSLKQNGILDNRYAKGVTILHLVKSSLLSIPIPVPTIEEQQQVVSELDLLSGVIEKQKAQLEELDKLAQSIFYDMFGDPVTNEKNWDVKKLSEVSKEKLSYGSGASAIPYDGELRYIRITDIKDNGELNEDVVSPNQIDEKYILREGDILFARSGATVGKTYRHREEYGKCLYAGYLIRLVPNIEMVMPTYVFGYTKTSYYLEFVRNAQNAVAQPNINAKQYGHLLICVPPLSLQQEFAAKVEAIEAMKAKVRQSLKEVETLFNERMDYYFN